MDCVQGMAPSPDVRQGWVVILCDLSGLPPLAQALSFDATDFVTAALSGGQRTQQRTAAPV